MERVEIRLSNEDIVALSLEAHDKNITLNQLILDILKKELTHIEDKRKGWSN